MISDESPRVSDPCSHDGECVVSCEDMCTNYQSATDECVLVWYEREELDDALCGCVDGSCGWFAVD